MNENENNVEMVKNMYNVSNKTHDFYCNNMKCL